MQGELNFIILALLMAVLTNDGELFERALQDLQSLISKCPELVPGLEILLAKGLINLSSNNEVD